MAEQQEIIKCTQCKKKFFPDGFKVNRLGVRNKTCLECAERRKTSRDNNKCPHGRQKSICKDCGGSGICEHNRQKRYCNECGGSQMCKHQKQKRHCQECTPSAFCKHGKCKAYNSCVSCRVAPVFRIGECVHGYLRVNCPECKILDGEAKLIKESLKNEIKCEHGLHKIHCRRCGAGAICVHDLLRSKCIECQ
jgi:hypothetical protein